VSVNFNERRSAKDDSLRYTMLLTSHSLEIVRQNRQQR